MRKKLRDNWKQMIGRCHNYEHKSFSNYGLRGIYVCSEWHDFERFYSDMSKEYIEKLEIGEKVVLDRIDNDLGYSKNNCRWATISENNFNKRPPKKASLARGVRIGGKGTNKFRACLNFKGVRIHIGMFDTVEEAHQAYLNKAKELYGYVPKI
jgi:hypothetical protein